jgi:hypothetical protein
VDVQAALTVLGRLSKIAPLPENTVMQLERVNTSVVGRYFADLTSPFRSFTPSELGRSTKVTVLQGKMGLLKSP